jgi:hypothetical protein
LPLVEKNESTTIEPIGGGNRQAQGGGGFCFFLVFVCLFSNRLTKLFTRDIMPASEAIAALIKFCSEAKVKSLLFSCLCE